MELTLNENSEVVDLSATLVECTDEEFHNTEHIWLCHSTENCEIFICDHCSKEVREYTDFENYDGSGINLAEHGSCDTPRVGERNSDGRVFLNGKWWKEGPSWLELYKEAVTIFDPAYRSTCMGNITSHAKSLLFGLSPLLSYTDILQTQRILVEKDDKTKA